MQIEELTAMLSQTAKDSEAKSQEMDSMVENIASKMNSLLEKNETLNGGAIFMIDKASEQQMESRSQTCDSESCKSPPKRMEIKTLKDVKVGHLT